MPPPPQISKKEKEKLMLFPNRLGPFSDWHLTLKEVLEEF